MGYNDMGDYFYQRGDLQNALKNYIRTRDYCTNSKHITTMCLNIIKVSIENGNFGYVLNYVSKAESTPDIKEQPLLSAKLKAASGLAHLESKKYRQAARLFIDVPFEIDVSFNEVLSPQDIGTYGGLCALASFDRAEIKSKIIDNPGFKQFLELAPIVRLIIEDFYHSRYNNCLKNLQQIRPELLLDLHLYEHVKTLYDLIRKKAIIQYFSPFQSVSLVKMAETFGVTVQAVRASSSLHFSIFRISIFLLFFSFFFLVLASSRWRPSSLP
jgi:COP9 signalosome complex subunit 1